MRPKYCPICRSEMICDAWETIEQDAKRNIITEMIYPAWVCSDFCGFYIDISTGGYE
jgi:hypothetical protein